MTETTADSCPAPAVLADLGNKEGGKSLKTDDSSDVSRLCLHSVLL